MPFCSKTLYSFHSKWNSHKDYVSTCKISRWIIIVVLEKKDATQEYKQENAYLVDKNMLSVDHKMQKLSAFYEDIQQKSQKCIIKQMQT